MDRLNNFAVPSQSYDSWDYYSSVFFPNSGQNQEATATEPVKGYRAVEISQLAGHLKLVFEKYNLARSQHFVRVFNGIAVLESKLKLAEDKVEAWKRTKGKIFPIVSSLDSSDANTTDTAPETPNTSAIGGGNKKSNDVSGENKQSNDASGENKQSNDTHSNVVTDSGKQEPSNVQYINGAQMKKLMAYVKISFEAFNDERDEIFDDTFRRLAYYEGKLDVIERRIMLIAPVIYRQRETILAQRMAISDNEKHLQRLQEAFNEACCCLCLERCKNTAFNCGHMFCYECAKAQMAVASTCPICRVQLTKMIQLKR